MLQELTASVRRFAGMSPSQKTPLVPVGENPAGVLDQAQLDLGALRGMTAAAADQAPCVCPEPCERDHANE